jgi:peroxiredoxin
MSNPHDLTRLPPDLPVPLDDGACDHLAGMRLPAIPMPSTAGHLVDLSILPGVTVVFCYPRTGRPDSPVPNGWDAIPGARGCTPQACAFRDRHGEFLAMGVRVFGLSAQTTEDQREAAERLHLPMELLSDAGLAFTHALRLPTFEFEGMVLIKRLTLVALTGHITRVFYPVFPPDRNAEEVVAWLRAHPHGSPMGLHVR